MQERPKRKIHGALIFLAVLAAAAALFFGLFFVTDVEVIGNTRYSEDQIREMALSGPVSVNTILMSTLRREIVPQAAFVERIEVEYRGRNKLRLTVHEKYPIGYIEQEGRAYYFDKDGVVLEVLEAAAKEETDESEEETSVSGTDAAFNPALTDVPKIVGLPAQSPAEGQKLADVDPACFSTILSLTKLIDKFDIQPDYVALDEQYHMTLWYGSVQVALGADELLEEKMSRTAAILPELGGMSGVLHLEEFTGETQNIIFSENETAAQKKVDKTVQ